MPYVLLLRPIYYHKQIDEDVETALQLLLQLYDAYIVQLPCDPQKERLVSVITESRNKIARRLLYSCQRSAQIMSQYYDVFQCRLEGDLASLVCNTVQRG